jgi:hypothetical protein
MHVQRGQRKECATCTIFTQESKRLNHYFISDAAIIVDARSLADKL